MEFKYNSCSFCLIPLYNFYFQFAHSSLLGKFDSLIWTVIIMLSTDSNLIWPSSHCYWWNSWGGHCWGSWGNLLDIYPGFLLHCLSQREHCRAKGAECVVRWLFYWVQFVWWFGKSVCFLLHGLVCEVLWQWWYFGLCLSCHLSGLGLDFWCTWLHGFGCLSLDLVWVHQHLSFFLLSGWSGY